MQLAPATTPGTPPSTQLLAPETNQLCIATVRGRRVIVDADLAALYGVPTKRFKRPHARSPARSP